VTLDTSAISYVVLTDIMVTDIQGISAASEVQELTLFDVTGGSFLLSLTDPVGNTTSWIHDDLDRMIEEINELELSRTFTYDLVGNLIERVDRLGRKIEFQYDDLYRLTTENWYIGTTLTRSSEFDYDIASRLLQGVDAVAAISFAYDNLGRVTTEFQSFAGFSPLLEYESDFDAAGRRTELRTTVGGTADFQNSYQYDDLHRLTQVTQKSQSGGNAVAEKRADFAYNAAGQFVEIIRHADVAGQHLVVSTEFTYDGLGRLLTLDHLDPDTVPLAGYEFAWDAASRIVSIDSLLDGLSEYTHDHTSQLTAADHAAQTNEVYEYDENGNRVMSGHVIGDNNQLLSDGTYNYTYDDEGNRSTRTVIATGYVTVYAWDHRNRLISVTEFDDEESILSVVKHEYDLFNRWIHRSVDSDGPGGAPAVDTYFSWFEGQLTLQFDGTAASDLGHRYFWNPAAVDQILAAEDVTSLTSPGEVLYPLTDHLGTTRDLAEYDAVEEETTVVSHRVFDSFGVMISETSSAITLLIGFTGRPLDESTGLQNNWNRWYHAEAGRWPSEDPIGFGGQDPNLARYVGNSPVRYVDPNGLDRAPQRSPGVTPWQAFWGITGHLKEIPFHIHQSASEAMAEL
jgi:RHS repeat-associated protein